MLSHSTLLSFRAKQSANPESRGSFFISFSIVIPDLIRNPGKIFQNWYAIQFKILNHSQIGVDSHELRMHEESAEILFFLDSISELCESLADN